MHMILIPRRRSSRAVAATAAALLCALLMAVQAGAGEVRGFDQPSSSYAAGSLIVGFDSETPAAEGTAAIASSSAGTASAAGPRSAVVALDKGQTLKGAAKKLARKPGVAWVKPNYKLRTAADWSPNDKGAVDVSGGWEALQWNFVSKYGVNALPAWRKLRNVGMPGGKDVVVAVIDTGVAYETYGKFKRSPDLIGLRVRRPWDFLDRDKHANDRNGHGTHVASTIAETTDNGYGLTGLAYGSTIMPLRALNARGVGSEATVARAIRYAVRNGAKIINLSVEFDVSLGQSDLPVIISAMKYARENGVLIVAAAGNQSSTKVAYPARSGYALAVGATTYSGCLADYSDEGRGIDLVAPGGGGDTPDFDAANTASTDRANCSFSNDSPPIYQVTFRGSVKDFYLPGIYEGTSMASPHVAATAALVIASGVIGPKPSPKALTKRMMATATDLGVTGYDMRYGAGIVNAGNAVTAP